MKTLVYGSTIYRQAYSEDIEEDQFSCSDFFIRIQIEICEQELDDNLEPIADVEVGILEVTYYDVGGVLDYGEDVIDIADSKTQEFSNAVLNVFSRRSNGLKDKYKRDIFNENIIYLDRLFIKPQYRGLGYAKSVISNIDKILSRLIVGKYACMIMLPAAFEYTDVENYDNLDSELPDGKKLTEKLYKFYKRHGFKSIPKSRSLYKVHDL